MNRQKVLLEQLNRIFQIRNLLFRQALAECLGTLILVHKPCGIGSYHFEFEAFPYMVLNRRCSVVVQWLSWCLAVDPMAWITVNFAFGFACTLGILVCGQVSGGHLNPCVTFALCMLGREPWRKFPVYFLFQTIGGFLGAAVIFGLYNDALWYYTGKDYLVVYGDNSTAGIFATYPGKHLSFRNGFFDQVIGTTALIVCILAIIDPYNNPVPPGLEPLTVGLVVLVIGLSMGFNSGYAVNPARDFGPRLFTAVSGWGKEVFTVRNFWFVVPIFAPFLGTIIGVWVYQLMVGLHLEREFLDKQARGMK